MKYSAKDHRSMERKQLQKKKTNKIPFLIDLQPKQLYEQMEYNDNAVFFLFVKK